jgi:hypothetical protein
MVIKDKAGNSVQKSQLESFDQLLDAIAIGVEAQLGYSPISGMVTDRTVTIAQQMRIPKREIQKWRSSRCCPLELV